MSTTEVVGVMTRYIQPTLEVGFKPRFQLQHGTLRLYPVTTNSLTNLFQPSQNVVGIELITPTNPISYTTAIEQHSRVASIFVQFDIKDIDTKYMSHYLQLNSKVLTLLKWLPVSIKSIFGDVKVAIQSLISIETGDPILEVKIATELPLDDTFDRNEKSLFKKIDDLNLANALNFVIITYA